jgi:Asp-tRNA(Asn)/Glu-tRNA(Gln) amidotransferase A subunit family amidase
VASAEDAFQVRKLRKAGAVIIGKANLFEFALGWTTVSSLGGQTLNPYDLSRDPGGSSGGTAVAVTANFAAAGLGTDTCGSIRLPAAPGQCGRDVIRPPSKAFEAHWKNGGGTDATFFRPALAAVS